MLLAFILFIVFLVILFTLPAFQLNERSIKVIYLFEAVYITILSFYMLTFSGDLPVYCEAYDLINNTDKTVRGNFEPLYVLLNKFLYILELNANEAVSLMTVLGIVGILLYIPKYSSHALISIFVYVTHFYFWIGAVLLRQTLAMVLLFPFIGFLYNKKYLKSFGIILLASLMHISSLVWLLVLLLFKINVVNHKRLTWILVTLAFGFGYFDGFTFLIHLIAPVFPRGEMLLAYLSLQQSLNIFSYLEVVVVLFFAMRFKEYLLQDNKYADVAITILIASAIIGGLSLNFGIGGRFVLVFNFFAFLIIIPAFLSLFRNKLHNKLAALVLFSIPLLIIYIRNIYVNV